MRKVYVVFFAISILSLADVCYAANWQTVKTITGSSDQSVGNFYIPTEEWQIVWSYTPNPQNGTDCAFGVLIHGKDGQGFLINSILANGDTHTSGTLHMHEGSRYYTLEIWDTKVPNYAITVQYDNTAIPDSTPIPELSGITLILAILLILGTLLVSIKKMENKTRNSVTPLFSRFHRKPSENAKAESVFALAYYRFCAMVGY